MENDLLKKWVELLKPIFPPNAEFRSYVSGDYYIEVGWKLCNAPDQLNKSSHSRKIQLKITEEAVEDYLQNDPDQRARADNKLKSFVEKKYSEFNPDHNVPPYKSPPVETWVIKTGLLNN